MECKIKKSKSIRNNSILVVLLLWALWLPIHSSGATKTATTTGNWSTLTWSPAGVPGGSDDIVINTGITVTMDADYTTSATLTLNGTGTIQMAGYNLTAGSLAASGSAVINNASTAKALTVGSNNSSTSYTGIFTNNVQLVKVGSGTMTLSTGTSSFLYIDVQAGTMTITSGSYTLTSHKGNFQAIQAAGTSAVFNVSGGTVDCGSNRLVYGFSSSNGSGTISGGTVSAARLVVGWNATGTVTISGGTNTFSTEILHQDAGDGSTLTLSGGTVTTPLVRNDSDGNATDNLTVNLNSGGSLTTASITAYATHASGTHSTTLNLAGGTLTANATDNIFATPSGGATTNNFYIYDNSGGPTTINTNGYTSTAQVAILAGTGGGITKSGTGTLIFNAANTYTTATLISAGTLQLGAAGVINDNSAVTVTGTLDMNTFSETVGSIAGAGTIDNVSGGGTPTLTCGGDGTNTAFSGTITDASGTLALTKEGAGYLTLSGSNTYSGTTTISAGYINLNHENSLGATSGGTIVASGSSAICRGSRTYAAEPITLNGTNGLRTSGSDTDIGVWTGTVTMAANSSIAAVEAIDQLTVSGIISGAFSLTTEGPGIVVLSNVSNSYGGSTTISSGTLQLGAAGVIPDGSAVTITGTLDMNNFSETVASIAGSGTIDNVSGGGTPTLTCESDYDDGRTTTFSGVIQNTSGTLSLTKNGRDELWLTGINSSYTGVTSITGNGVLRIWKISNGGVNSSIGASSNAASNLIIDFGRFAYNGTGDETDRLFTLGTGFCRLQAIGAEPFTFTNTGEIAYSGSGARSIDFWGPNSGHTGYFSPIIGDGPGGATQVYKQGTGTWTLSGANTYTGATTISVGTLKIGSTAALGSTAAGTTVSSGAALDLNGITYTTAEPLTINGTGISSGGAVKNSSATGATYAGLITLGSASSIIATSGGITLSNTGTILGDTYGLTLGGAYDGTLAGVLGTGTGTLTKQDAGTWYLTGNNTYTGTTTISGGVLAIGNNTTTGAIAGASIVNNATLALYRSDAYTYSGVISGTGFLAKGYAGTTTLTGDNTYNGQTQITNGILEIGNGGTTGSISSTSLIDLGSDDNSQAIIFNRSDNITYSQVIQGGHINAMVQKLGTGTLTLSGANTYLGSTIVSAGTLKLGASGVIPDASAVGITASGTLEMNGFDETVGSINGAGTIDNNNGTGTYALICGGNGRTTTFSGIIQNTTGTIAFTKEGIGALTLSGANTYTGTSTLSAGQLNLNNASAIGTGTFIIEDGTTIDNTSGGSITLSTNNPMTWNGDFTFTGSNLLNLGTGAVAMGASLRTVTTTASTLQVFGVISGTGGLTKAGAGTLTVGGTTGTCWTGTTTVNDGTLILRTCGGDAFESESWVVNSGGTLQFNTGNSNMIINTAIITINTGGTWDMNSGSEAIGYIAGGGNITNMGATSASGLEIDLPATGSGSDFSGVISGVGRVNIRGSQGTGTQILSGLNTYTGPTLIKKGTLSINTIKSVSDGASSVGAPTTIANGTIAIGSTTNSGTLVYTGTAQTTDRVIDLAGTTGGATITQSGTGLLEFTSNFTATGVGSKTLTLQGSTAGTAEISGELFNSVTTTSLTKAGTGTWTLSGGATFDDVTLSAGTLNAGASTINIYGNFANSGTFTKGTSTVDMKGGSAQTLDDATFNNLTISNTSGGVQLTNNITVDGTLTMSSGVLTTTGAYSITLGSSGSINETTPSATAPTSYVTGSISTTRTVLQSVANTFGGMGLSITEDNIASNSTQVTRVTGTASTGGGGNTSITRYFTIDPTTDAGLNATLLFYYQDHELTGHTEANLILFKSNDNRSTWQGQASSITVGTNELSLTGITSFSDWTASDNVAEPLPVELLRFEGNNSGGVQRLEWATASEINSAYFEVLRSTDGYRYDTVGKVASTGHSSEINTYDFKDNYSLWGPVYYMLVEYDTDGNTTVLDKLVLYPGESAVAGGYNILPNPASDRAYFSWQVKQYKVYSLEGNLVLSGNGSEIMNVGSLAPGHYMVHADQQTPLKLIVVD